MIVRIIQNVSKNVSVKYKVLLWFMGQQMMEKSQNPRILNLYIAQKVEVCAVRICWGNWNNWHSLWIKVSLENLIVAQLLNIWKSFYGTRKFIINIQTTNRRTLPLVTLISNKYHKSFHSAIFFSTPVASSYA